MRLSDYQLQMLEEIQSKGYTLEDVIAEGINSLSGILLIVEMHEKGERNETCGSNTVDE